MTTDEMKNQICGVEQKSGFENVIMPKPEASTDLFCAYLKPRVESCWQLMMQEASRERSVEFRRRLHSEWAKQLRARWRALPPYEHSTFSFWLTYAFLIAGWLLNDSRICLGVVELMFAASEEGTDQKRWLGWRLRALKVESRALECHLSGRNSGAKSEYFDGAYEELRAAMSDADKSRDRFHASLLRRVARLLVAWNLRSKTASIGMILPRKMAAGEKLSRRKCVPMSMDTVILGDRQKTENLIELFRRDWEYD